MGRAVGRLGGMAIQQGTVRDFDPDTVPGTCSWTTAASSPSAPRRSTPAACGCSAWASGSGSTPTPPAAITRVTLLTLP